MALWVSADDAIRVAVNGRLITSGRVVQLDIETERVTVLHADGTRTVETGPINFLIDLHECESVTVQLLPGVETTNELVDN